MIVLSLFNGMSTGHTALDNVGIKVDKYYSSEIKPSAIKLTQYHYPDTIQLGDITNWKEWNIEWKEIDMVLSGSPCQDLSIAGKRKGLEGERSGLFWIFVDILNHIKELNPDVLFLQENVGSAPKKDVGIMSRALGVYPVRINSSLVTAQMRDRYYWSNIRTRQDGLFGDLITDIPQPKDRKIMFKDIVQGGAVKVDKSVCLVERTIASASYKDLYSDKAQKFLKERESRSMMSLVYQNKSGALLQGDFKMFIKDEDRQDVYLRKRLKNGSQTPPLIYEKNNELRCKTNTKKGYDVITDNDGVDLSYPKSTSRRGRVIKGKSPCLLTENKIYKKEGMKVRTVNKVEMCRLQGFPDDWCDILTKNQAGSLLGDGWTLPIIEHIFSYIGE
tara:strand:- start:654 stop:1817 length:1164 start_codon:yes stop_codon:yes gene_type:complete